MQEYIWGHNKRFNHYAEYFKILFGTRVQKVTLDAGFTCPNRDGTISTGGCVFCNNDAFNPSYCQPSKSITQQLQEGIEFHFNRYRRAKNFLAYFQAYSNTFASIDVLKQRYTEALSYPGIIGLVIGTRPDCVDNQKLDYIQELAEKYYITVEYGVETCNNETLKRINRGHTFEQAAWAIEETAKRKINTGAHFIIGLPGEEPEKIIDDLKIINSLPLNTIKFHQLQIVKNTQLEKEYLLNPSAFKFMSLDNYLDLAIRITEQLNPKFVIERIAAEMPPRYLAGESWGLIRVFEIMRMYEKLLEEKNTWQGRLYS